VIFDSVEAVGVLSGAMNDDSLFRGLTPCDRLRLATAYLVLAGSPHALVIAVWGQRSTLGGGRVAQHGPLPWAERRH